MTIKLFSSFIILLIASMGISQQSFAQTKVGIGGGVSFATLFRDGQASADGRTGFNLTIGAKQPIGNLGWHIRGDMFYSSEGYKNQRLDYLRLPVCIGFDFSEDFNIFFGWYASTLVRTNEHIDTNYKKLNTGSSFGVEVIMLDKLGLQTRINTGIPNIVSDDATLNFLTASTFSIDLTLIYIIISK